MREGKFVNIRRIEQLCGRGCCSSHGIITETEAFLVDVLFDSNAKMEVLVCLAKINWKWSVTDVKLVKISGKYSKFELSPIIIDDEEMLKDELLWHFIDINGFLK